MICKYFLDKRKYIVIVCTVIIFCICIFVFYRGIGEKPNIVLITIDALRADHLGCYGYQRNTSPNIDDLSKQGATFLNCFSTAPATPYSCVTLLTGRYLIAEKNEFWNNLLDNKFTTLAEYLKGFGYYTMAFICNVVLRNGRGFEQGFDYFLWGRKKAEQLTEDLLNSLNQLPKNKPFFAWIHYLDTHPPFPLGGEEEYFKKLEGDRLYQENDKVLVVRPNINSSLLSGGYLPKEYFHEGKYSLNYYIAKYDSEISYVDYWIGNLLKALKANTVIILTADHGEYLGEHNIYLEHGEAIYDQALFIPLIIRDNRYFKGGKKIPKIISSIDITPTILSRINHPWYFFNKNRFNGLDLRKIANGELKRKYIYSYFPWAYSVRDVNKNIKYILHENGGEELFFLPDEERSANYINDTSLNVLPIKTELREALKIWLRHYPIHSDINAKIMPPEKDTKESLKSLGYLQ